MASITSIYLTSRKFKRTSSEVKNRVDKREKKEEKDKQQIDTLLPTARTPLSKNRKPSLCQANLTRPSPHGKESVRE